MAKVGRDYLARQAEVLQRHHGDRDRTRVAGELGVSLDQMKRYLLGKTMLRPDLVAPLAAIYGTDSTKLARELGIIATEVTLAELLDDEPELSEDDRREILAVIAGRDETESERRAIVQAFVTLARKRSANPTQERRRA